MSDADDSAEPAVGPVERCAWAKLNLYLHVTGRRPDGYHEIDSLIVFAGLGDRLRITLADQGDPITSTDSQIDPPQGLLSTGIPVVQVP